MTSRSGSLIALVGLVVLALGGWALWMRGGAPRAPRNAPPVDDDLEMLAAVMDAGGARIAEVLVAGTSALYVARGPEGVIEARSKFDDRARPLARLGAPVAAMALAGDSLWVTSGRTVTRVPADGGPVVLVTDNLTRPHAVASDGRWVFVVDVGPSGAGLLRESSVVRVPAAGGERVVVGRYQGEVTNVALDDDSAYWADRLDGTLFVAPKNGGPPRALVTDRGLPGQVLVDGESLYWVEKRSESLWSMPKSGGPPHQLAQDFAGFAQVVVEGASLAWVDEAAVDGAFRALSVVKTGGDVIARSPPVDAVDGLASDGTRLFWLRDDAVAEVPAAP